jgi:hypothetical protein
VRGDSGDSVHPEQSRRPGGRPPTIPVDPRPLHCVAVRVVEPAAGGPQGRRPGGPVRGAAGRRGGGRPQARRPAESSGRGANGVERPWGQRTGRPGPAVLGAFSMIFSYKARPRRLAPRVALIPPATWARFWSTRTAQSVPDPPGRTGGQSRIDLPGDRRVTPARQPRPRPLTVTQSCSASSAPVERRALGCQNRTDLRLLAPPPVRPPIETACGMSKEDRPPAAGAAPAGTLSAFPPNGAGKRVRNRLVPTGGHQNPVRFRAPGSARKWEVAAHPRRRHPLGRMQDQGEAPGPNRTRAPGRYHP